VTTRKRTPLPAIPHHRRRTGQPRRHGLQLPPARHPRPGRGDYPEAEPATSNPSPSTQTGNRAGRPTATTTRILARPGVTTRTAERRYQQSLTINAELGNRAGIATSISQLGTCMQQRTERARQCATLQGPSHPPRPQHPPSTEQHQPTSRTPHHTRPRRIHKNRNKRLGEESTTNLNQLLDQVVEQGEEQEHNLPGKMEMRPLEISRSYSSAAIRAPPHVHRLLTVSLRK